MGKEYLAYHQYTIMTYLYPILWQSVIFLIDIMEDSARPLSIAASFQQHLQFIPSPF